MTESTEHNPSFADVGITPKFLAVLNHLHFTTPTPIQLKAIPVAISGKDVIGIAQTGTGKTLAFGIPMIQRIAALTGQGLILLPTRELALQVDEVLKQIGGPLGLRTAVLIGGAPMGPQLQALRKKLHIVIATPGRLLDHVERRSINLKTMPIIVLDEADRMLDMGFAPQMKKILSALPNQRQIMLFSATMPPTIVRLATTYMKLPLQIEVAPPGTLIELVEQEFFMVRKEDKIRLLETLLKQYTGTVLVFSRTKHGAKKICRSITAVGYKAAEIHSNRSLNQRREALNGFKSGKYRVLVATDIAARGIDVNNIELVVNFDIPEDPEDYVHRIGRTGRAGKTGKAISFVTPDQKAKVRDIERLTRTTLPLSVPPELAPARYMPEPIRTPRRQPRREYNARHQSRKSGKSRSLPTQPRSDKFFTRTDRSRSFRDSRSNRHRGRASRPQHRTYS